MPALMLLGMSSRHKRTAMAAVTKSQRTSSRSASGKAALLVQMHGPIWNQAYDRAFTTFHELD